MVFSVLFAILYWTQPFGAQPFWRSGFLGVPGSRGCVVGGMARLQENPFISLGLRYKNHSDNQSSIEGP